MTDFHKRYLSVERVFVKREKEIVG